MALPTLPDIWDAAVSIKGQTVLAGAVGGACRWLTLREDWRSGLISVCVGGALSAYGTPLVLPLIEPWLGKIVADPASIAGFSGLMIGLGGIAVTGLIMDFWKSAARRVGVGDGAE